MTPKPTQQTAIAGAARGGGPDGRLLNRELSWLDFNARVLALAEDPDAPLLERAKFLAIFASNLDEFFQVRVAGLYQQVAAAVDRPSADGLLPTEQLEAIHEAASALMARHATVCREQVLPALAEAGIAVVDGAELDDDDRAHLDGVFDERIFPVLTPLAVDPGRPFPFVSDLSLNLAVVVAAPRGSTRFARVKVPGTLPRFFALPDGRRFVPLEQVIAARLDRLFTGMRILASYPFRVTRNADFEIEEDEAPDLLDAIQSELQRRRFGRVVRLSIDRSMPSGVLAMLRRELAVDTAQIVVVDGLLGLHDLWELHGLDRPELHDEHWPAQNAPQLAAVRTADQLFTLLRDTDVLVHHPYELFESSVQRFIELAADDPSVLAIKQTLYRTSADSPIIDALIRAAEDGKQAVALVELKARFDEAANIEKAQQLEEAGVHVVYGLLGLKTHSKICLVVRREPDGIRRYAHIGTGNYNPSTAKIYEDLGRLTAEPEVTADLSELFNVLTGYSRQTHYRRLLVAPHRLRDALLEQIEEETAAGEDGAITLKANALLDPELIEALYRASESGVEVSCVVRGISTIRPGVPGLSERIHVRSIVGRYLEHSRIYRFGREPRAVRRFIGSADAMPRNLDRRVEALTSIEDPAGAARLDEVLDACLRDDVLAWEQVDATWHKLRTVEGVDAQALLHTRAVERSGTPAPAR